MEAKVITDHIRRLIGRIDHFRPRMSYNDSYFGEPTGLLKGVFAELAAAVDPIYPEGHVSRDLPAVEPTLESVEARYRDLLNRLGVNGHDGAITEINNLRKIAGFE